MFWKEQPRSPIKPKLRTVWSGGAFQVIDANTDTVIFALDTNDMRTKLGEVSFIGRWFLPTGEVLADADDINDASRYARTAKVATGALAPGAADAISFAWANPEATDIIVYRAIVDITTAGGTATAELDVGQAADAVTGSNNIIDGVDANATGASDNLTALVGQATIMKVAVGEFVNGQIKVAKADDLEGNYFIFYATA